MRKSIKDMSNTELSNHLSSVQLRAFHQLHHDVNAIRELTRAAVANLAGVLDKSDDEFDEQVPKALFMLALLDHMTDQRTIGEICDYLNF